MNWYFVCLCVSFVKPYLSHQWSVNLIWYYPVSCDNHNRNFGHLLFLIFVLLFGVSHVHDLLLLLFQPGCSSWHCDNHVIFILLTINNHKLVNATKPKLLLANLFIYLVCKIYGGPEGSLLINRF